MSREIPLTRGLNALVDDEDYAELAATKWFAQPSTYTSYARRYLGSGHTPSSIGMHRVLMQPPEGLVVDHINGNGLDNRRVNLRVCTQAMNCRNRRKQQSASVSSQYKGVTWEVGRSLWRADVYKDGRHKFVGRYSDEIQAAREYDAVVSALFGPFAKLNFESPA